MRGATETGTPVLRAVPAFTAAAFRALPIWRPALTNAVLRAVQRMPRDPTTNPSQAAPIAARARAAQLAALAACMEQVCAEPPLRLMLNRTKALPTER